jgi:multiple sugar transport system substrate-binding protein
MAETYDLMVIDHPSCGRGRARGNLLPLDGLRDEEMAALAAGSVGASHASYEFAGRQWALAIDAATPVAARRPDLLDRVPADLAEVLDLARQGLVGFALVPINALMSFFGIARNLGYPVAEDPERLLAREHGQEVLGLLREVLAHMDPACSGSSPSASTTG